MGIGPLGITLALTWHDLPSGITQLHHNAQPWCSGGLQTALLVTLDLFGQLFSCCSSPFGRACSAVVGVSWVEKEQRSQN